MEGILQDESPLPLMPPPITGEPLEDSLVLPGAQPGKRPSARAGRQHRWALILEPHRKLAELLSFLLDFELDIQSVSVPRPRLIPTLFRGWTPDLIIAEIPLSSGLPSADDLELLRPVLSAAQMQPTPIPVLLCTTYTEITPARAESAGFAGLIYKPFTPALLISTVRALLVTVPAASGE